MAYREFQSRLDDLRDDVLDMGDLVRARLDRALHALYDSDETRARSVIDSDEDVNDRYLDLEAECISLLALQQRSRAICASSPPRSRSDLERIADLAKNLAGYAIQSDHERFPEIDLHEIGHLADRMVADALDAYATGNDE